MDYGEAISFPKPPYDLCGQMKLLEQERTTGPGEVHPMAFSAWGFKGRGYERQCNDAPPEMILLGPHQRCSEAFSDRARLWSGCAEPVISWSNPSKLSHSVKVGNAWRARRMMSGHVSKD